MGLLCSLPHYTRGEIPVVEAVNPRPELLVMARAGEITLFDFTKLGELPDNRRWWFTRIFQRRVAPSDISICQCYLPYEWCEIQRSRVKNGLPIHHLPFFLQQLAQREGWDAVAQA